MVEKMDLPSMYDKYSPRQNVGCAPCLCELASALSPPLRVMSASVWAELTLGIEGHTSPLYAGGRCVRGGRLGVGERVQTAMRGA